MRGMGMSRAATFVAALAAGAVVGGWTAAARLVCAETPEFKPAVTDVTVFKDGHALIMARAKAKLDNGWCRTREVPAPVLGMFWAFAADKDSLVGGSTPAACVVDNVRAGNVEVKDDRPCLTLDEIIQANAGKSASIVELLPGAPPVTHAGTLLGILESDSKDEIPVAAPSTDRYGRFVEPSAESVERKSKALASFVMLKQDKAVRMIKREHVAGVSVEDPQTATSRTRTVREIALHVAGARGRSAGAEGDVGLVYLQKGIRWIPEYRIELLDGGQARVTLQATIINEILDLDNVNLRLVVGVPSFIMKDTLSPLALRDAAPKLSSYFAPPAAPGRGGQFDNQYLSNAMMSQAVMPAERGASAEAGPNVPAEGQNEDLYLYHKQGFSLRKGERAVLKLLEVTVAYEDVYKYEVPPLPPRSMWRDMGQDQVRRLAGALSGAKVMHVLRLTNSERGGVPLPGDAPWTTGPAAIFKSGAPLAQQLLTYTSVKNKADLAVTVATDLNPQREETEIAREPNNIKIGGNNFSKITMHGKLTLSSFKDKPVHLVIVRKVFGAATNATAEGKITATNLYEDTPFTGDEFPWYAWPWWTFVANPVSVVTWDTTLPPGKSATFEYDWSYYQYP